MARIKKKELEDLIDPFEAPYTLRQPKPVRVGIEDGLLWTQYSAFLDMMPLEESDLFTSFANLAARGDPSEAKIKRWVSRFGLPKWGLSWNSGVLDTSSEIEHTEGDSMSVGEFRREARYAHGLLELYLEIRGEDAVAIRTRLNTPQFRLNQKFKDAFEANRKEWNLFASKSASREEHDGMILLAAWCALGEITNRLVAGVRLRSGLQRAGGLSPSWECPDLPSAIYLQFYLIATKHKPMRYCENCGNPFEATRSDHKTCSDSCRTRLSQKRRRASNVSTGV
jgi:predicted nucleic acid-binding Zn ribbon protein